MIDPGLDPRGPAVTDAELIRYLDGELTDTERVDVTLRVHADAASAARLDTLRRRSAGLQALLARTDEPQAGTASRREIVVREARRRAPSFPLLRAAAIVLAVAAAALLVPPVRAWLVEGVLGRGGVESPVPTPPASAGPAATADPLRIAFTVQGEVFVIEIERGQSQGELIVDRRDGEQAAAELIGDPSDADLMVRSGSLRISNRDGATASYRVSLPASVRTVTVRGAGGGGEQIVSFESGEATRILLSAR